MSEKIANNASTTLSGSIDSSQTTLVVASATGFPSSGNFRLKIDSELLLVTAVAGTTWTVTRGIESTGAAGHSNGASVIHVLTAGGLETYMGEYTDGGLLSALPSTGRPGKLYFPNDSAAILRDTGSGWNAFGPAWRLWTPDDTGYSWGNQQSATYTVRNDGILIDGGTVAASTWSVRGRLKNRAGTSTGYKLTVGMMSLFDPSNFAMAGMGLYESGTGKVMLIRQHNDSASPRATVISSTQLQNGSATNLGTSIEIGYLGTFPLIHWMQVEQTATDLVWRYSTNQIDWFTLHTASITSFFTTNADQFLLHVLPYSQKSRALFVSVREET